jgi:hypothetical protein
VTNSASRATGRTQSALPEADLELVLVTEAERGEVDASADGALELVSILVAAVGVEADGMRRRDGAQLQPELHRDDRTQLEPQPRQEHELGAVRLSDLHPAELRGRAQLEPSRKRHVIAADRAEAERVAAAGPAEERPA